MVTRDKQTFLKRDEIYAMLTKEDQYAGAWAKGRDPVNPIFPAHAVSRRTGQPFSESEWMDFAQKYIDEARQAIQNYCPDMRAVHSRMMKAASLLVTALQVHGEDTYINDIAGVSAENYPIFRGGLKTFKAMNEKQGVDAL